MRFNVSPMAFKAMIELKIESGIDTAIMHVLRQLPKKSKINAAVKQDAMIASCNTLLIAARTKMD